MPSTANPPAGGFFGLAQIDVTLYQNNRAGTEIVIARIGLQEVRNYSATINRIVLAASLLFGSAYHTASIRMQPGSSRRAPSREKRPSNGYAQLHL